MICMQKQQASILSILIPTYNESQNILKLLEEIKDNLLDHIYTEIIIVDDNSPDRTGRIVEYYAQTIKRIIESKSLREQQLRSKNNDDNNSSYFSIRVTLKQYGLYLFVTSFGIAIQLGLAYMFVESAAVIKYEFALITISTREIKSIPGKEKSTTTTVSNSWLRGNSA